MKDLLQQIEKEIKASRFLNKFLAWAITLPSNVTEFGSVLQGTDDVIAETFAAKEEELLSLIRSSLEKAYKCGKQDGAWEEAGLSYEAGKAQTLKDLREKIEGMSTETEKYHAEKMYKQGRFDALTDLLTALEAHDKKI